MNDYDNKINELLVHIFDKIIVTEERALQVGRFADLSISEMHTLEGIGLYEAGTMSETAERLSVTTGTLTVAVDKLVKKGYINRERDEKDKRVVRISLTKKGKLAYRLHLKFHSLLVDRITKDMGKNEKNILLDVLTKISDFIVEQDKRYMQNLERAEKRERTRKKKTEQLV